MKDSKILLTGATGFLGSEILKALLKKKYKVVILKRTFSNISRIQKELNDCDCISFNIDSVNLEEVFINNNIKGIIHAATLYGRGDYRISEIINSNLIFPIQLMELGIKYEADFFINSDTFFTSNIELPEGLKVYVSSKKQFVEYAHYLINSSNLKFLNVYLEQLYGPSDNPTKFIPTIIKSLLNNQPKLEMTEGTQKRDFIYISDAVSAYVLILENSNKLNKKYVEYRLGSGSSISIKEVTMLIKNMINSKTDIIFGKIPFRRNEIIESIADITELNLLGWRPEISIDKGIEKTIEWYISESNN